MDEPLPAESGTVRSDISGDIVLKNVSLNYDGRSMLKNISLSVRTDSKYGIIKIITEMVKIRKQKSLKNNVFWIKKHHSFT